MMPPTLTIIVAAGTGSRFGSDLPKQFCRLLDRPVLMHTIDAFRRALPQGDIVVVVSSGCRQLWDELCERCGFESPRVVEGGATRWESVKRALESSETAPDTVVLVHDGARPVVDEAMVERIVSPLGGVESEWDGVIPAIAVSDTLRLLGPDGMSTAVDRAAYRAVQTPQAFPADRLRRAYQLAFTPAFTDDASVMTAAGYDRILLVDGSHTNIKITHPADLNIAEIYLSR